MFKILMIDDEKSYHELYKEIITDELNVEISFATNGLDALEILSGNKSFDLLILDLDMPKLDGTSTLKNIRKNPSFKNVPIFILTANSSDENQKKLLNLGANDFISKGCAPEIFIARLKNLVKYKETTDQFNQNSGAFEQLLETALVYLKNNLCGVIDEIDNSEYLNKEGWFTAKSRILNKFDEYLSRVIDKIESPASNLEIKEYSISNLSSELEKRKAIQFGSNTSLSFGVTSPDSVYLTTDVDIFFLLISAIYRINPGISVIESSKTNQLEINAPELSDEFIMNLMPIANIANLNITASAGQIKIDSVKGEL